MYWWKGTWITALELSQKNERENPEVDSHKYPQLIFMKMQSNLAPHIKQPQDESQTPLEIVKL